MTPDKETEALSQMRAVPLGALQHFAARVADLTVNGEFSADTQQALVLELRRIGANPALFMEGEVSPPTGPRAVMAHLTVPLVVSGFLYGKLHPTGALHVERWELDTGDYSNPTDADIIKCIREQAASLKYEETDDLGACQRTVDEVIWTDGITVFLRLPEG